MKTQSENHLWLVRYYFRMTFVNFHANIFWGTILCDYVMKKNKSPIYTQIAYANTSVWRNSLKMTWYQKGACIQRFLIAVKKFARPHICWSLLIKMHSQFTSVYVTHEYGIIFRQWFRQFSYFVKMACIQKAKMPM